MYPRIICTLLMLFCIGKAISQSKAIKMAYERARIRLEKKYTELDSFTTEGLARAVLNNSATYIDSTGKPLIPYKYNVRPFSEGLGEVAEGENGPCYFIDKTGKRVLDLPGYMLAFSFSNGYAVVEDKHGLYGVIDKKGKEVMPCVASLWPQWLTGGNYAVDIEHEKTKVINVNGGAALPVTGFSLLYYNDVSNTYLMKKDEGWFLLNRDGTVKKTIGAGIYQVSGPQEGTYVIRKDKGDDFALMDGNGNMIVPYGEYNMVRAMSEGLACVGIKTGVTKDRKTGMQHATYKMGFINKTGKLVIPLQFEGIAEPFCEGLAIAKQNGKLGFIDKTGKWIIRPQFDDASPLCNGYAKVAIGNQGYYIDAAGQKVQ